MDIQRFLFSVQDFLQGRDDLDELEQRLRHQRSIARVQQRSARSRIDALETELGHATLLAHVLADLCLAKGLVTREELARLLMERSHADGEPDPRHPLKPLVSVKAPGPKPVKKRGRRNP